MARHIWSVLCERSVIDADDQQLSLHSVTERLNFHQSPEEFEQMETAYQDAKAQNKGVLFPASLHLVSFWVRSDYTKPEKVPLRYRVLAVDGWEFPPVAGEIDLENNSSFRVRWKLESFLFRGFGRYWISVQSKTGQRWRTATRIPLELVKAEPKFPRG